MSTIKNVLFIMVDQLRWDYLSCYGHPHLKTPNLDELASKGVRFDRAYVQSPVCGPSRASTYTGRTVFSHGATWNRTPLNAGELGMKDYLDPLGVRTAVVGKTHMVPDFEVFNRIGVDPTSEKGKRALQPCFEHFERDDGLHPDKALKKRGRRLRYNTWLNQQGYEGDNPWEDYANAAQGENGEILSAWYLKNSNLPARVKEEHSETAYMTSRAMDFIEECGDQPWLCHLSLIKPHWPYMAPAPYHDMFGPETWTPIHRSKAEKDDPHPVYHAFTEARVSETFSTQGVRETVLPAYMGLIKQIDDHMGRLFAFLKETGRDANTMIVFTSDHGEYLGDHWLGEKELFHECSARVPLIVYDPRAEADSTRGTSSNAMVEAIDLLPTFVEAMGGQPAYERLEGRSIAPLLHGETPEDWRDDAYSEIDYSQYAVRQNTETGPSSARAYMIRTESWKYIYFQGYEAQLFDMKNDPDEFVDLGRDPAYQNIRDEMQARLFRRMLGRKNRITMSDAAVAANTDQEEEAGILIGVWN